MTEKIGWGCKGAFYLSLAAVYLWVYVSLGIDAYVYFGCALVGLLGVGSFFIAAVSDD